MGFNPVYKDMGFVFQMYYVWFEWGHFLSSSIVWTEVGEEKRSCQWDSNLGGWKQVFFRGNCGNFTTRADTLLRERIIYQACGYFSSPADISLCLFFLSRKWTILWLMLKKLITSLKSKIESINNYKCLVYTQSKFALEDYGFHLNQLFV